MDWRLILAEFLASLVARLAPALIELIANWLEGLNEEDKVALVTEVGKAIKSKVA